MLHRSWSNVERVGSLRHTVLDDFPPIFEDDGKLKPFDDGSIVEEIHIAFTRTCSSSPTTLRKTTINDVSNIDRLEPRVGKGRTAFRP